MKTKISIAIAAFFLSAAAFAQLAEVSGKVKDEQGNPVAGATVQFQNTDTGQKYPLKTDKKGEYRSIAIQLGKYKVTFLGPDGKQLFYLNNVTVSLDANSNIFDYDPKKERELAAANPDRAHPPQLTEEQKKQIETVKAENAKYENLDKLRKDAQAKRDAGDFSGSVALWKQGIQQDPNQLVLWYGLAETQAAAAQATTDKTQRQQAFAEAAGSFKKAGEVAEASTDPKIKAFTASVYNNYADSLQRSGNAQEALGAFSKAADLEATPAKKATYYFNAGAVASNRGMTKDCVAFFDKAIEVRPEYAEAYFQKGSCLIAQATTGKDGKIVAPEGTTEAYGKYLELDPNGSHATEAKATMEWLGTSVESYKAAKKPKR